MNKKILILILVVGVILVSGLVLWSLEKAESSEFTKQELLQKFQTLKIQYKQAKAEGYDVTETKAFARQAKQAFDRGDYKKAKELLDKALTALEKTKSPPVSTIPTEVRIETICTDGIDNDGDGLTDNEDGDCWIREGPIYKTHPYFYPKHSFKEITQQIPQLADLGIKTINLPAIWEMPPEEGALYYNVLHIKDYYKINAIYGTSQDLKELIDTAHKYNLKVIFYFITCCTPKESIIYNNNWTLSISLSDLEKKASELGWKLKYTTIKGDKYVYYNCQEERGCDFKGMIVGDKVMLDHYPFAFWGFAVDRTNPEVINYFMGVAEYYVKEYGIDGWWVDAPSDNWNPNITSGDHSIIELLSNVKKAIIRVNSNAVLVAESAAVAQSAEARDPVLDIISEASYSWYFNGKIRELIREKNSTHLIDILNGEKIWYNRPRVRFMEMRDVARNPAVAQPLVVLLSTIPGIPAIPAGLEIEYANQSHSDSVIDWANGNYEARKFYKKVFEIRNKNNALKYGSIKNVWKSGDNTFAYSRTYKDETVVVVINFQDKAASSILNLPFNAGTMLKDELSGEAFTVTDAANFKIAVPAYGSRILTIKR